MRDRTKKLAGYIISIFNRIIISVVTGTGFFTINILADNSGLNSAFWALLMVAVTAMLLTTDFMMKISLKQDKKELEEKLEKIKEEGSSHIW